MADTMTDAQRIEALELEKVYRRELVHAANTFPNGVDLKDLVDYAIFVQAATQAIQTNQPMITIERYATVTEVINPYEGSTDAPEGTETTQQESPSSRSGDGQGSTL